MKEEVVRNILFYGSTAHGGAERQMVTLAKLFSQKGYRVFFVDIGGDGFYEKMLFESKVIISEIKVPSIFLKLKLVVLYHFIYLWRYCKKNSIEICVSFLSSCNFVNCLIAMVRGKRFTAITGLRNARESLFLSKSELLYTHFERYASFKVCNSENAKKMYAQYFPQYTNKLKTIYNIVILPAIDSKYEVKRGGRLNVVVAGSYRKVKNPQGLIDAVKIMSSDERQLLRIEWYGANDGGRLPYYVELKREVESLGLQDIIHLNDSTQDIADIMNQADVIALFSSSEGLPNCICEGMMLKKPILMTKVSDYNVLVDSENGCLCEWNNPKSIKDALLIMANLPEDKLQEMGESSYNKAFPLFSDSTNLEKWVGLLNNKQCV